MVMHMSGPSAVGGSKGIDRVWRLVKEGYQISDVDSDDLFVGVRMERAGESVTLLLTREDFALLFPSAEAVLLPFGDAEDLLADR